jgi:dihydroxyacid dehydratase/phosphogluconate dehydratase
VSASIFKSFYFNMSICMWIFTRLHWPFEKHAARHAARCRAAGHGAIDVPVTPACDGRAQGCRHTFGCASGP